MLDFLSFRRFFTPTYIGILFWIGLGVCIVEGLSMLISGARFGVGIGVINGLLVMIVGPIGVRVLCELIMAVFRIHESLTGSSE